MQQRQGAIVIAIIQPAYAYMAHALACALSITRNGIPTTLVTDAVCAEALGPERLKDFDTVQYLKPEHLYHKGKKQIDRAKLFLPEYSPYDVTAALDADCCWFLGADPGVLFNFPRYKGVASLVTQVLTEPTQAYWNVPLGKIRERFPDIKGLSCFSGACLIYDTKQVQQGIFAETLAAFDTLVDDTRPSGWHITDQYPIELPLSIMLCKEGQHQPTFIPLACNIDVNGGLRERWQLLKAGFSGINMWGRYAGQATEYLYCEWHRELQALLPHIHDYVPKDG